MNDGVYYSILRKAKQIKSVLSVVKVLSICDVAVGDALIQARERHDRPRRDARDVHIRGLRL